MNLFYLFKSENTNYGGEGARVSDFFYKGSKSKIFSFSFFFFLWGGGGVDRVSGFFITIPYLKYIFYLWGRGWGGGMRGAGVSDFFYYESKFNLF